MEQVLRYMKCVLGGQFPGACNVYQADRFPGT